MSTEESNSVSIGSFFKRAAVQPHKIMSSDMYISAWKNVLLLLCLAATVVFAAYILYLPLMYDGSAQNQYAGMGLLVVYLGLFSFLFLAPVMVVHFYVFSGINHKWGRSSKIFAKMFSDYSAILIPTFILYAAGLYFYSLMDTFQPYLHQFGILLMLGAVIIYITLSVSLVHYYVGKHHKTVTIIYAVITSLVIPAGLIFFVANII
ncbi:hypothetical protein [Alkalicoccus luteus]|uniref:hypothetical protein n=1 Tax=Alkalicoccus luteus TaxID=1237094 RepID=UPI00403344CC